MTKLSVNVNKIATLRNTRPQLHIPDLVRLSRMALEAGADGITIHPRPDERHIRASDIEPLVSLLHEYPGVEFNMEGNPFEGDYLRHCLRVKPTQCTLVPDSRFQTTSDHGWSLPDDIPRLHPVISALRSAGCRVSLFMNPLPQAMAWVANTGAERVELYTEPFAAKFAEGDLKATADYREAALAAHRSGLGVNAGHDLSLDNLPTFLREVPHILEVSIGHALIADALEYGIIETVRRYRAICAAAKPIGA